MAKSPKKRRPNEGRTLRDWVINSTARGFIFLAKILPYGARIALSGWLFKAIIGPLSGRTACAHANLRRIYPNISTANCKALARASLDNIGRTTIELFSVRIFRKRAQNWPVSGPGLSALKTAREQGRGVVFVTGHYSNHAAAGTHLDQNGFKVSVFFREMNNAYLNGFYARTIGQLGRGAFPRNYSGFRQMHKHLRAGGAVLILTDQYIHKGVELDFLGHPAATGLAAAELALRYNAPLIPIYANRQANGIDFNLRIEPPITHGKPVDMMRAVNDSLSAQVHKKPGEWFWVHRRWRPLNPEENA